MTSRVEAFILKTQAGQWMVEVWRDGGPIECTSGLETELDAIEDAVKQQVEEAVAFAKQSPYPDPAEVSTDVYAMDNERSVAR